MRNFASVWPLLLSLFTLGTVAGCEKTQSSDDQLRSEMSFRFAVNEGALSVIAASGRITSNTPEDFQRFMENERQNECARQDPCIIDTLAFDSLGGDVIAALELGRLIRQYQLRTIVASDAGRRVPITDLGVNGSEWQDYYVEGGLASGTCFSACAYAFLGGVQREIYREDPPELFDTIQQHLREGRIYSESRFGVHQFAGPNFEGSGYIERTVSFGNNNNGDLPSEAIVQFVSGSIIEYLIEMNVDTDLFLIATKTPPHVMQTHLSDYTLASMNVITQGPRSGWNLARRGVGGPQHSDSHMVYTENSRNAPITLFEISCSWNAEYITFRSTLQEYLYERADAAAFAAKARIEDGEFGGWYIRIAGRTYDIDLDSISGHGNDLTGGPSLQIPVREIDVDTIPPRTTIEVHAYGLLSDVYGPARTSIYTLNEQEAIWLRNLIETCRRGDS